jgi:hypothetical protein
MLTTKYISNFIIFCPQQIGKSGKEKGFFYITCKYKKKTPGL